MAKETNNKYEIMAESSGNIQSDAAYKADADRVAGVVAGVARSILYNTASRQNSKIAVAIANFMARKNPLTDIDTALTTEQLDALLEDAIKDAAASGPGSQVITATYVSGGRFVANITPYVFNDQNKLTIRYSGVIPDADLDLPVILSVDNGVIDYPVKVKDAGNEFLVRNTITEIADIFRDGSDVIINRTEPAEASEQEYNFPIQSQQTIVPVEASPFGDNRIDGESAIQVIPNGDFANGTIIPFANVGLGSPTVTEGIVSFISTIENGRLQYQLSTKAGDKVLRIARVKSTSTSVGLAFTSNLLDAHSGSGEFEILSNVRTEDGDDGFISITDNRDGGWDTVEVDWVMIIPLLSVKQQTMSLSDLNKKYPVYFENLKSVENPEIKVTNRNVFNKDTALLKTYLDTTNGDLIVEPNIGWETSELIGVEQNEDYSLTGHYVAATSLRFVYYDKSGNFISGDGTLGSSSEETITLPNNAYYLRFSYRNTDSQPAGDIMFNKGSSSLPFIKHDNSSKKYPNQILRDVPNGAADWIDTENNVLHKNIETHILTEDDITSFTNGTNVDYIRVNKSTLNGFVELPNTKTIIMSRFSDYNASFVDEVNAIEKFTTLASSNDILIMFDPTLYADLAAAKTGIAGTFIQYQLAEEVITENIDVDGIAFAYKNMTIELIQANGFGFSVFAKHDLNDAATIRSLGKALQTAEKQITNEEENREFLIEKDANGDTLIKRGGVNFIKLESINMTFQGVNRRIGAVADPVNNQDAVTKAFMNKYIADDGIGQTLLKRESDETEFLRFRLDGDIDTLGIERKIKGIKDPTDPQDVATKKYVDDAIIVDYDQISVSAAKYLSEDNILTQTGNGFGAVYSPDGNKLYVLDSTNDTIYQYTTKKPFGVIDSFDTSKALGTSLGLRGLVMKEDGSKVIVSYINSTNIESFDLDTDYEINTLNLGTKVQKDVSGVALAGVRDIAISLDGLKFYYLEHGADDTIEYATFSSAWDLSTLSDQNNFDGSSINIVLNGIAITETGGKMLVIGSNDDKIFEIIMPILFSFTGAIQGPDSNDIPEVSADGISIAYGSGVVLIADPAANTVARYMFATASRKLTDALVSLAP